MTDKIILCCRDACGVTIEGTQLTEVELAQDHGWTFLGVAGGYRCGACWRAPNAASRIEGNSAPSAFVDSLPPDSIGALRKVTANTISAPSVRP